MNQLKIALIAVVAVLLLFQVAVRWNEPARLKQVKESFDGQAQALEQVSESLQQLDQRLAELSENNNAAVIQAMESLQTSIDDLGRDVRQLGQVQATLTPEQIATLQAQAQAQAQANLNTETGGTGGTAGAPDANGGSTGQQGHVQVAMDGDGLVKEGENFLLPPSEAHFKSERVQGTFRGFDSTPAGLNPIIENAANVSDLHGLCNDTLCTRDSAEPSKWRSLMATSVIISEDYTVYTFKIRKGVNWQIPRLAQTDPDQFGWLDKKVPLTAHDFVFYVEMAKHPDVQAPAAKAYLEDLEKAEALDDYTLRLTWSRKIYTSLSTSMALDPLPKHIYAYDQTGAPLAEDQVPLAFNKHWFDEAKQIVGVGAWQMWEYKADDIIKLRRNRDYWGAGFHFDWFEKECSIRDPDPKLTAFKNGQVSTYSLRPTQYKTNILDRGERRFDADNPRDGELGWEKVKSLAYNYIGWNMRRGLFQDRRVRQAMSHAFPKRRIIDEVFFGLGKPQVANVHPDSAYFNADLEAVDYQHDLNRAQELLFEAGWEDSDGDGLLDKEIDGSRVPFRFELKYYANSPEWDRTLGIYQAELRKLGIEMTPLPLEWKFLIRVYEDRDFDAVGGGWRMGYEVDFEQLWHSKFAEEPRSSNHCGFANEEADKLAEQLRVTFDFEERKRIAKAFQAIIHREMPYTFFKSSESIFAWQNKGPHALGGVTEALDSLHPFYSRSLAYWYERE